ncbi:MAG: hypothetical protein FJ315_04295 [SAR202 cluster bacterium]|nr:hypothetical protein [SAR202 cluster bacterium]
MLVYDSEARQFRPVGFGPTTVFEFHPDGTWCVATAEAVQGCLVLRPFTANDTLITPQGLKETESPFRYRWRMVDAVLLLTMEQPQGNDWVPLVRWAVEKKGE